ncbi:hypothetical protein QWY92_07970 [Algibacter miyuki]|uniref:hypothetical protein n=1 Tax=Algibacter miyuki TaxID=1306933 RepID=UPI0025B3B20A|nr:hypothetical protein [Algibacter miyuki]MDN3665346.1 hypothetical protein [Algibacter miyuki]
MKRLLFLKDNGDGTITYTNENGNDVTINMASGSAGQDGTSVTVTDNGDGTSTISDGTTTVIVSDGKDGVDGVDELQ